VGPDYRPDRPKGSPIGRTPPTVPDGAAAGSRRRRTVPMIDQTIGTENRLRRD